MPSALMLCYTFPPASGGGVPRSAKFVRYLPQFSWRPVVLCQEPEPTAHRDDGPLADLPEDVCVRRIPSTTCDGLAWRLHGRMRSCMAHILSRPLAEKLASTSCTLASKLIEPFYRPDYAIGFLRSGLRLAVDMVWRHNVSVIYASSPPASILLMGLAIKRLTGLPLVCDLRDPLVGHNTFHEPPHWWRRERRRIERLAVAGSDVLISAVDTATADLVSRYPDVPTGRFRTVTNGYDANEIAALPALGAGDGVLRFVHAGSLHGGRSLDGLFEAVDDMIRDDPTLRGRIEIICCGPGGHDAYGRWPRRLEGVLKLRGTIAHRSVRTLYRRADVLLLPIMDGTTLSVPGKTYEYLGLRREIMLLGPGDCPAARLVRQTRSGRVLDATDVPGIREHVEDLMRRKRAGTPATPPPMDLSMFHRQTLAGQLAEIFDEAAGRRKCEPVAVAMEADA